MFLSAFSYSCCEKVEGVPGVMIESKMRSLLEGDMLARSALRIYQSTVSVSDERTGRGTDAKSILVVPVVEDPARHVNDIFSARRVGLEEVHRLVRDAGRVDLRPVGSEVLLSGGEDRLEVLDRDAEFGVLGEDREL